MDRNCNALCHGMVDPERNCTGKGMNRGSIDLAAIAWHAMVRYGFEPGFPVEVDREIRALGEGHVPDDGGDIRDLRGLLSRLDYLNDGDPSTGTDLEVDAIWLMPVFASPRYHGYDTTDYETINPDYGTNTDFERLVKEAHRRGIKVIVDLVAEGLLQLGRLIARMGLFRPFSEAQVALWRDAARAGQLSRRCLCPRPRSPALAAGAAER